MTAEQTSSHTELQWSLRWTDHSGGRRGEQKSVYFCDPDRPLRFGGVSAIGIECICLNLRSAVRGEKFAERSSRSEVRGAKFVERSSRSEVRGAKFAERTLRGRMKVWIQGGSGCGSMVDPWWIQVDLGGSAFFECYKVLQIMGQPGWIRRDHLPLL